MSNKYIFNSLSKRNIIIIVDSVDTESAFINLQSITHGDWRLQYVAENPVDGWMSRAFDKKEPTQRLICDDIEKEHNPIWDTPSAGGMHYSGKIATITEPKLTNRQEVAIRLFTAMLNGSQSLSLTLNPEWASKEADRLAGVLLKEIAE